MSHARGIDVDDAGAVEGDAAPVHAAAGERKEQRALRIRRRVQAVVAQRRDAVAAGAAIEGREAERVFGAQTRRHERRHVGGEGLRRRQELARRAAFWHRALFDRKHGLAGLAVEHEDEALFGRLYDNVTRLALDRQRGERRLGREVIVPDVVLDDLEGPGDRAIGRVQGDDRVRVPIGAGPQAAEEVGARARGRQEHELARFVDGHGRPHIRRTCGHGRIGHQRLPAPAQRAGAGVEGTHPARRRGRALVVADRRADDHDVAGHHRCRRDLQLARPVEAADVHANLAALAEVGAGKAGTGIEGDQPHIGGGRQDAQRAGRRRCRLAIAPLRDATAVEAVGRAKICRQLRIEAPGLGAAGRIERDHFVERRAEHELVGNEDGCGLEFHPAHECRRPARCVAGAIEPLAAQPVDIGRRHEGSFAESLPACVAAVEIPARLGSERAGLREQGSCSDDSQKHC